jgi:GNAT superfamily N-acetyltransferase
VPIEKIQNLPSSSCDDDLRGNRSAVSNFGCCKAISLPSVTNHRPIEYRLVPQPPSVQDYRRLRDETGLHAKNEAQASAAIAGSWAFCHVQNNREQVVAMGRAIGDGGWYFHLADIVTSPDHQRHGLGRCIVIWLLDQIRTRAPEGAYVSLIASASGAELFEQVGFSNVMAPQGVAMQMVT